jgi:flavin-dependent dehydrogenase
MDARRDVAVIGAGPAGCAAAIALKRLGVASVLLLEGGDGTRSRFGESLPPDIRLVLAQLGLGEAFTALGFDPCVGAASSWGEETLGYNDFLFNPHGLGWHIDRARFDAFLRQQAVAAGVELRLGATCDQAAEAGEGVRLRVRSADGIGAIDAGFVLDATGRAARVARALGAERIEGDRLTCVAALARIDPNGLLGQRSLLEAVDYGWWYAARLSAGEAIVVVSTDADLLRARRLHQPDSWRAHLARTRHVAAALGDAALGQADQPSEVMVRQARSSRLSQGAGPRWRAIGDAASVYDPIMAQGVTKAMVEGIAAARDIARGAGGDGEIDSDADAGLDARFADYLSLRDHFYRQEGRWPDAPFWARRRTTQSAVHHPREVPA